MAISNDAKIPFNLALVEKQKFYSAVTLRGKNMTEVLRTFVSKFNQDPDKFFKLLNLEVIG